MLRLRIALCLGLLAACAAPATDDKNKLTGDSATNNVPAGSERRVDGDVLIDVAGDLDIAGDLIAATPGAPIAIAADGDIRISGSIVAASGSAGQPGGSISIISRTGSIEITGALTAGDGGGGPSVSPTRALTSLGGGNGGSVTLKAFATLTIASGPTQIHLGNGGDGTSVTLSGDPAQADQPIDNRGGDGGVLTLEAASAIGLTLGSRSLSADFVDADGVVLAATGTIVQTLAPQDAALFSGGDGGDAGAIFAGIDASGNYLWTGGAARDEATRLRTVKGAKGGDATIGRAGRGANVTLRAPDGALPGDSGEWALAFGGDGGSCAVLLDFIACTHGQGGDATAIGGNARDGGNIGGRGGNGTGLGGGFGHGWYSKNDAPGGKGRGIGGAGGKPNSTCASTVNLAGSEGGQGGNAYAHASNGARTAIAGNGGNGADGVPPGAGGAAGTATSSLTHAMEPFTRPEVVTDDVKTPGAAGAPGNPCLPGQPITPVTFYASQPSITQGQSSTLTWTAPNADTCSIAPDVGAVGITGNAQVTPLVSTVYSLSCNNPRYGITAMLTVNVTPAPTDLLNITVFPIGAGGVFSTPAGIDCGVGGSGACSAPSSGQVFLVAIPAPSYAFVNWTGDCAPNGTSAVGSIIVTGTKNCFANFRQTKFANMWITIQPDIVIPQSSSFIMKGYPSDHTTSDGSAPVEVGSTSGNKAAVTPSGLVLSNGGSNTIYITQPNANPPIAKTVVRLSLGVNEQLGPITVDATGTALIVTTGSGLHETYTSVHPYLVWTKRSGTTPASIKAVGDHGSFIAVTSSGYLYTTPAGDDWMEEASYTRLAGDALNATALRTGSPKILLAAGGASGSALVHRSVDDGAFARLTPSSSSLNALADSGTRFVAVGDQKTILTSTDGASWSSAALDCTGGPVAACLGGALPNLKSVAWNGTRFLVVGASGFIASSTDGLTFSVKSYREPFDLYDIATSGGGSPITIAAGSDGVRTVPGQTVLAPDVFRTIIHDGTRFVAVGAGSTLATSPDGAT